jgi:hypothetical protein
LQPPEIYVQTRIGINSLSARFNRLIPWIIILILVTNAPLESLSSLANGSDGFLPKTGILNSRFRELLPDIGLPDIGRVQIKPSGKFGYRRVGWKAEIPIPYTFIFNDSDNMTGGYFPIKLNEVDLWIAEAALQAKFGKGFSIFASISGNILQSALNKWLPDTREEAERLLWKQREFIWMEAEFGCLQPVLGPLCMEAGLRYDDFRLVFKEPHEIKVSAGSKAAFLNLKAHEAQSKIWIPYIGFGFDGVFFKAFAIGSVFAPSSIRIETRISANSSQLSSVSCYTILTTDEPATYFELNAQYLMNWLPLFNLSLWGKSGWVQVSGSGRIQNDCSASPGVSAKPFEEISLNVSRHDMAAGLSLNIVF